MCLLVVLSRVVPGFPLIVGANRDERLERPAVPMDVLRPASPRTLGGRDGLAGGTWLAVNEHGIVAGLTNRPNPDGRDATKRSRGELPLALTDANDVTTAVDAFVASHDPRAYNAAWLLVGDRTTLVAIEMADDATPVATELPPGIHVLENRACGDPSVKVDRVRALLADVDGLPAGDVPARLWQVLADHQIPAAVDDEVPDRPVEVNAACVHTDGYGTRWSAVITVADEAATRPSFMYTDGPPCTSPRLDASPLWDVTPPGATRPSR
jgi:uncharacterized protein with NRDE domain